MTNYTKLYAESLFMTNFFRFIDIGQQKDIRNNKKSSLSPSLNLVMLPNTLSWVFGIGYWVFLIHFRFVGIGGGETPPIGTSLVSIFFLLVYLIRLLARMKKV